MDIKMIVSDLDSTLLTSGKTISPFTVEVLKQKQKEGIKVIFATGRPYRVVDHFYNVFRPDYSIVHNGSVIYEGKNIISHAGISPEDTKKSIAVIRELFGETDINVEIEEVIYRNCELIEDWKESASVFTDFSDLPQKPAEKIIIFDGILDEIEKNMDKFPDSTYLQIFEKTVGALLSRKGTKLKAINLLAKKLNIPLENIACFGDDLNDMEMLSAAGYGIAMANALPQVKACAKYITESNDDDGVAKWLEANT